MYFIDHWLLTNKFADTAFDKNSDLTEVLREMYLKWQIWSLDMYRENPKFRKLTSDWHSYWVEESQRIRLEEVRLNSPANEGGVMLAHEIEKGAKNDLKNSIHLFRVELARYVGRLQRWQAEVSNRENLEIGLTKGLKIVEYRRAL